tara:strand:- start:479 stop:742 length:264 start_codon:yes stop_codon:yes gene_type:complete
MYDMQKDYDYLVSELGVKIAATGGDDTEAETITLDAALALASGFYSVEPKAYEHMTEAEKVIARQRYRTGRSMRKLVYYRDVLKARM